MTAIGTDRRWHAGARVRVTQGAHAGRVGTLLAQADTPADITRVQLDIPRQGPGDHYVRIRRHVLEVCDA